MRFDGMLDAIRIPMIGEAVGQPARNPGSLLHVAQEDAPGVGGDLAAVEPADDIPAVQALNHELGCGTLCGHKVVFMPFFKLLMQKHLYHRTRPLPASLLRFPG